MNIRLPYLIFLTLLAVILGLTGYLLGIVNAQEAIDQSAELPEYYFPAKEIAVSPKENNICLPLMEKANTQEVTPDEFTQIIQCHKTMYAGDKVIVKDPGEVQNISISDLGKWGTQASMNIQTDKETRRGQIIVTNNRTLLEVKALIK